jgi:hypothetical protein
MRLSNSDLAINEKLQLQKRTLNDIENRSKNIASKERIEAL